MKRITIIAILFLLWAAEAFAQDSNQQLGLITELSGTVELKLDGAENYVAAKTGDIVAMKTIVSTGFKSSALITVGSTILTVRPLTRLSLAEISSSAGQETLSVSLQAGRVRVDVKPPAGTRASMHVQSPIATASVRGTSFEFDTQSLTVLEGTVVFTGNNGEVKLVNAGGSSEILYNGMAADPMEISIAELALPSYAGNDTGFRHGKVPDLRGDFEIFDMVLR